MKKFSMAKLKFFDVKHRINFHPVRCFFSAWLILLFCIMGVDCSQAKAYSVTVQKDGIYAEAIPDSFVNNTAEVFKKNVKKAMKSHMQRRRRGLVKCGIGASHGVEKCLILTEL